MPAANNYLEGAIPNLYRREHMHVSIFTFIDTYKFLFPSVTNQEAANAYLNRYKIDDSLYTVDSVIAVYYRVSEDLKEMHKKNKK